ncbi:hypothetical protein [Burkholderia cepacia]|uniref:hypothetical protein n=1 Tax=Burkholderia cepacia TaxID=292 RepID=UPI000AD83D1E|nr:hypothetical protein [Burkholderia cepacia]
MNGTADGARSRTRTVSTMHRAARVDVLECPIGGGNEKRAERPVFLEALAEAVSAYDSYG